jgi:hypothetical protein
MPQSSPPEIPPLFKSESVGLHVYASKDGTLTVNYPGWDARSVPLL